MWWFVGIGIAAVIIGATRKQMKEDEQRRKDAFARFRDNFPGWGE